MLQIRQGIFETNSSSTHAISVCSKADWDMLQRGDAMINRDLQILPMQEALAKNEELSKYAESKGYDVEDYLMDCGYMNWDDLYESTNYEFYTRHSTISGVDVVAFGYYGYDY